MSANIADYLALIPPPNSIQPNFMAWVQANLQPYIDCQNATNQIITAFDINTAVGVQLDVIGQILGVSRIVNFQPQDGSSPTMTDAYYRLILLAKILQNQWDGTIASLYSFFKTNFPGIPILVKDNQDMTMSVLIFNQFATWSTIETPYNQFGVEWQNISESFIQELFANGYIIPKPAGVLINYSFSNQPIFAYDSETGLLKGYDESVWATF